MSHLRALLATLRIANAPSVVSNVWLGFMVGWIQLGESWSDGSAMPWSQATSVCLAGLLLYFAGNLANDWFDRHWDAVKRPERALPSGLFNPTIYLGASLLLATGGIATGFVVNPMSGYTAIAICGLIATYTYFHKKAMWSVIPMGLCRAGLYFLGFFASWLDAGYLEVGYDEGPVAFKMFLEPTILAIGLFVYITGLSLSARYEGMKDAPPGPKVISLSLLVLPIMAMSCPYMGWMPLKGIVGMVPFAIWLTLCLTRFRKPIPRYVSALLAGIPLVDFIAAAPIALGLASRVPQKSSLDVHEFPPLLALLLIPLAAFILGRLLQKVAPAT